MVNIKLHIPYTRKYNPIYKSIADPIYKNYKSIYNLYTYTYRYTY